MLLLQFLIDDDALQLLDVAYVEFQRTSACGLHACTLEHQMCNAKHLRQLDAVEEVLREDGYALRVYAVQALAVDLDGLLFASA